MRFHVTDRSNRTKQLVATMLLESADQESSEIWLITPWLKNVEFNAEELGPHKSLLGSHRSTVTLLELLEKLSRRHLLHVVIKPPHELVSLPLLERIVTLQQEKKRLLEEELDFDLERSLLTVLEDNLRDMTQQFLTHADTLLLSEKLANLGAKVSFRDALHAKLLWLPSGALFGSANFTNGGLTYNAELIAEVLDDENMAKLQQAAESIEAESHPRERYDFNDRDMVRPRYSLASQVFFDCANDPSIALQAEFKPLLEYLGGLYR